MIRDSAFSEALAASPEAVSIILSAAGFDDISKDELLVLGALALSGRPGQGPEGGQPDNGALEDKLARELGLTEPQAGQLIGTLAGHGYLEPSPDRPGHGPAGLGIARRGQHAIAVAANGLGVARWIDFPFRPGDIVISTLPKSGTTWVQMICALLIFQSRDLPAPLPQLSPWLESDSLERDEVYAHLAAQQHRRFIKTHLPLHEIAVRPDVTYIVVARHPLDVAVSMYYQDGPFPLPPREWLIKWIQAEDSPWAHRNSLPGAMRRMAHVWAHREPNVLLVHYQDLSADLAGEMRRLAAHLGITVSEATWPSLVKAATFEQMRATAEQLVDRGSDPARFFRKGTSGSGTELLNSADLARYHERATQLAPLDLLAWLHRDDAPADAGGRREADPGAGPGARP